MIISASRRTDIPAFYPRWFINRVRAGYCAVPHPFNRKLVRRISLAPDDVDVIVFWTRNPRPLFPYLDELDELGYRYYFHYTLLDYPHAIDQWPPPLSQRLRTFRALAERIGPERVIWRYDPIIFSQATPPEFHLETYRRLVQRLRGSTQRCVISVLTVYEKLKKRVQEMAKLGAVLTPVDVSQPWFGALMSEIAALAADNHMQIASCAMEIDLVQYGIRSGKCVDDDYIETMFGLKVNPNKDPGQRKACGCVVSKDIGMYNSCLFGCRYCYATGSFERARRNYVAHNPASPSLLGWYEAPPEVGALQLPLI
jgi:hypothetical protein